jgi:hypothetical protein
MDDKFSIVKQCGKFVPNAELNFMKQKPALYVTIQEQIPLNYNRVGRP